MLTDKTTRELAAQIEEVIGPENVTEAPDLQLDGLRPALVVRPASRAEVARSLEICSRFRASVVPAGLMTWLECGNPVRSADVVVSLSRMNKVVDYSPADLTLWAEAGIAIKDVSRLTRAENQWLPLDPPGTGSLGAVVACASSGPLRFGCGTPRDYVIGLKLAHIDGTESKSGGRVVKNVAGYDLNKLYVGSFGTLAVITEVILKLRPVPESSATVLACSERRHSLDELASKVMASRLCPASVFILNPAMARQVAPSDRGWVLAVRFLESAAAVRDQVDRLRALGNGLDCELTTADTADEDFWPGVANLGYTSGVALKASVPLSRTTSAIDLCQGRFAESIAAADLGMGLIRFGMPVEEPGLTNRIQRLRTEMEAMGGALSIERGPAPVRREADAWGDPGPAVEIMRHIKQSFDPYSLLSPGRFVRGCETE